MDDAKDHRLSHSTPGDAEVLRKALEPFAELLAGSKKSAPPYVIKLPIYPEGADHPLDWRPKISAAIQALAIPSGRAQGEAE